MNASLPGARLVPIADIGGAAALLVQAPAVAAGPLDPAGPSQAVWPAVRGARALDVAQSTDREGRDNIVAFTRGGGADAFVARSTGSAFGPAALWHGASAFGDEIPRPSTR